MNFELGGHRHLNHLHTSFSPHHLAKTSKWNVGWQKQRAL